MENEKEIKYIIQEIEKSLEAIREQQNLINGRIKLKRYNERDEHLKKLVDNQISLLKIISFQNKQNDELKERLNIIEKNISDNSTYINQHVENQVRLEKNIENNNTYIKNHIEDQVKLEENIRNNNTYIKDHIENQEKLEENIRNNNTYIKDHIEKEAMLEENIRNNNTYIKEHIEKEAILEENIRNNNMYIREQMERQLKIEENLRNNNEQIDNIKNSTNELYKSYNDVTKHLVKLSAKFNKSSKEIDYSEENRELNTKKITNTSDSTGNERDSYVDIDYFDFEDHFRGSRELIKKNQEQYLEYYKNKKNVIDIGCGRGEFVELLSEHNIDVIGVDFYDEFVEYCNLRNLKVIHGDAISYLEGIHSTGGIFAGQLVEHLTTKQLIRLCEIAYEKLEEGAYFIIETPNPKTLAIFAQAFYIDPSHIKPVHPLTLEYILKKAGFKNCDIIYTETSKLPVEIPALQSNYIDNLKEFNEGIKCMSDILFGSQDYAIVARK